MKKWMAMLLAFAMVLSLCACGGGETSAAGASEQSGSTESEIVSGAETVEESVQENGAADQDELSAEMSGEAVAGTEESTEPEMKMIEFEEPILLWEDETITIELINFYEEETNWGTGAQVEKIFTVKATNNSDHEISANPGNFYLNDESVWVCMLDGSLCPDPGKSANYSFIVAYDTTPEHTALI